MDVKGNLQVDGDLNVDGDITLGGTVDGIDIATDVAANTAKTSNATHTGDVTGDTALTLDKTAITGQTLVTASSTDHVLVADASDTDNLKKVLVSDLLGSGTDSDAIHDNVAGEISLITEKVTPVAADLIVIEDSAAANAKKRVQVSNLKSSLDLTGTNSGDEPDASLTVKGIVELATVAETDTGTDATRAVTPAGLANIQSDVDANTAKVTNVTTNLSTTQTTTTVDVVSSDGTDATLPQAIASGNAGVMSGADKAKLDGVEALADVTDTANVTAAGALMDSEVDADIKTLVLPASTTISTFGASLVDDVDAPTARATLGVDPAGTDNTPAASTTVAGKQENATTAEVDTGTAVDRTITPDALNGSSPAIAATNITVLPVEIGLACSDETTDLTTGTAKLTFRMPHAMTLTGVRANVNTAPTGSVLTVDINEGGVSVLSTKLTIDATEKTSQTAVTPPVISDSALADDAEITIDIDGVGSTIAGKGLKVWLIGTRA
jgi:hypothetical protein